MVYDTVEDLLLDASFSVTPFDGIILETTIHNNECIVGILYNPDKYFEFYQLFLAKEVENGYRLMEVSYKIACSNLQYGTTWIPAEGPCEVALQYIDDEMEIDDTRQDHETKLFSNGRTVWIGLGPKDA